MKPPSSRTPRNAASSLGISGPYSALTSTSGIVCIRLNSSFRPPPIDQIRRRDEDPRHDGVLDVAEVVVGAVIRRAEPIAGSGEGERPDRRADERAEEGDPERHFEDARRDRDERAEDTRNTAEKNPEASPA